MQDVLLPKSSRGKAKLKHNLQSVSPKHAQITPRMNKRAQLDRTVFSLPVNAQDQSSLRGSASQPKTPAVKQKIDVRQLFTPNVLQGTDIALVVQPAARHQSNGKNEKRLREHVSSRGVVVSTLPQVYSPLPPPLC